MIYLSHEWFAEAAAGIAALVLETTDDPPVQFGYVVEGVPNDHPRAGDTVRYQISLRPADGAASLAEISEDDESADVQFRLQYADALQIASGQRSGSRAFLDGDIRVGGEVSVLIARSAELEALSSALPSPAVSGA